MAHRSSHSPNIKMYLILFLCLIPIVVISLFFITQYRIKTVKVIGNTLPLFGLEKLEDQNLFLLDENKLKKDLLSLNFGIQDIKIEKVPPDSIYLTLKPFEGESIFIGSPSAFLISENGKVLKKVVNPEQYPLPRIIDGTKSPHVGDTLDSYVVSLLTLSHNLRVANIFINRIEIARAIQEATIVVDDGTEIKLLLDHTPATLSTPLQIIISRFRIEGRLPSVIDFRYARPIVTFKNGEKISP